MSCITCNSQCDAYQGTLVSTLRLLIRYAIHLANDDSDELHTCQHIDISLYFNSILSPFYFVSPFYLTILMINSPIHRLEVKPTPM